MTEKLFTGALNHNQYKKKKKKDLRVLAPSVCTGLPLFVEDLNGYCVLAGMPAYPWVHISFLTSKKGNDQELAQSGPKFYTKT